MKKMVVPEDKVRRAYNMHALGVPIIEIAKEIAVDPSTIHQWKNKQNWNENQSKDLIFSSQKSTKAKRERGLAEISLLKNLLIKAANEGKIKFTARDYAALDKAERLMTGQSTENIAVDGQLTIKDAYATFLKRKGWEKEGKTVEWIDGILPVIDVEYEEKAD